ncbi:hypothetical protein TrVFT333_009235 [Trichoderma virens FT-333]|nr:hypothetical protein TrVFT333_009235 [Trichoderma virens FT-333]
MRHGLLSPISMALLSQILMLPARAMAMAKQVMPTSTNIDLTLTPLFEGDQGSASAINVNQVIWGRGFRQGQDMFALPINTVSIDMGYVSDAGVLFSDAEGELQVTERIKTSGPSTARVWKAGRPTVGNVSIVYTALPRPISRGTKNGPALDFRLDQGGLVGSGMAFLGAPPYELEAPVHTTLRWDLSRSPEGTLAAWSMGDGEGPFEIATESLLGIASGVQEAYFAVGPLNRLTSPDDYMYTDEADVFNMYWFGTPTFDPLPLGDREAVLAHEMVHNWVLLTRAGVADNWYHEGLAEYYQVLLRFRFGSLSAREYLEQVNEKLVAYYTSPLVTWPLERVQKVTWNMTDAQRVPYLRGFTFALQVNDLLRSAGHSIDDLVRTLADKMQAGESVGVEDYLKLLSQLLGDDKSRADALVMEMKEGKLLVPGAHSLEKLPFQARLVRHELEKFELGFDESSLLQGPHIVKELIQGSRAQLAGLQNGDRIQLECGSTHLTVRANMSATMKLKVFRDGSAPFVVEFWPRSQNKVEAYQYEVVENEEL